MKKALILLAFGIVTLASAQEELLTDEDIYQPEEHYEKVEGNLYRATYRLPRSIYPPFYYPPKEETPREWLEKEGAEFGEGASATFDAKSQVLEVVQTLEELSLVEVVLGVFTGEASMTVFGDLYELPILDALPILETLYGKHDQTECHQSVLKMIKEGSGKSVVSMATSRRSGTRGKMESIKGSVFWVKPSDKDETKMETEEITYGTVCEFDVVLGSDNSTVDLNTVFTHDTAPPEFTKPTDGTPPELILYRNQILTQLTLKQGETYLAGTWHPAGPGYEDKQVIQLLFFYVKTIETGAPSRVNRVPPK